MKRRAIFLVDLNMFFGGGQVYLERLARLLNERVDLHAFCVNPEVANTLRGVGVHAISFKPALKWGKLAHVLIGSSVLVYAKLRYRIDTLWVNGIPDIVLLPLGRVLGCSTIATRHLTLDIEAQGWYRGLKRRAAEYLYRHLTFSAQKIICVSKAVADDLARIVRSEKLLVIPNWVSILPEIVNRERQVGAPLRLLFVGRLQHYKGASFLFEAMRLLQSDGCPDSVSLTIVGEGRYMPELQREAVGINVEFAGFQKDTSRFYKNADVFVNPSIGPEGMPLVSLEAMSFGLPSIFSDLPVHKEITSNGNYALLFRSGDAGDLSSKIGMFLSSEELLQRFRQLSRDVIENRYCVEVARREYFKALGMGA
jgi:glycosyltransferase involved in cell wall biosynthesis